MTLIEAWNNIQGSIKEKIGETTYETWFSSLQIKVAREHTLTVETPDEFFKNWIVEHYSEIIKSSLGEQLGSEVAVEFVVGENMLKQEVQQRLEQVENSFKKVTHVGQQLNESFTFENFVIGPSNRFASAASLAVAESPAKAYNPLFIYGQVGLGKTHLLQSISHKIRKLHPSLKICYISSEKFTNDLIESIRHRSTEDFRKKYRNIDVLLIDDIQFIAGKEATQEEFFHTFNSLHNDHKQIILSSDRPPKDIVKLEERLQSRFAWGLASDIQPPDFETRVAILRKKVDLAPFSVPPEVITFIAEEIKTNIRELEGALIRVTAYSALEDKLVTLEMAKNVLKDMVKETTKAISIEMIQKAVVEFFHTSIADLRSKKRNKSIVLPRQIAMYLARNLTNMSLPDIGNAFGGRDHTTVMHSLKKIEDILTSDDNIKNAIRQLTTVLKQ